MVRMPPPYTDSLLAAIILHPAGTGVALAGYDPDRPWLIIFSAQKGLQISATCI